MRAKPPGMVHSLLCDGPESSTGGWVMGRGPDDGDEPDPPRSGGRDKRVYYAQESAAPPRPVSKPRDGYDTPARSPYPPADRGRAYGDGRGDGGGQAPPPRFPSRPP